jgi:hypothetical protein
MQKLVYVFFLILISVKGYGQTNPKDSLQIQTVVDTLKTTTKDSLQLSTNSKEKKRQNLLDKILKEDEDPEKAKVEDYLIISHRNDTTYVDTTLTIQKDYKYNYLRRDNFGLMPFTNIGQTYNSLTYNFNTTNLLPSFGASARHFNYMGIDDVFYYNVPTPLTELLYKTAFEQGQLLESFFTVNTSPQFNFSIAYKGLRSLGQYQHTLTSTGNFRVTTNYRTKNNRYRVRGHIVMQDLSNEENGGLQDDDVINFESGEEEFLDRPVFDPNFENAENLLEGKRFYLDHSFSIFKKAAQNENSKQRNDTLSTNELRLAHTIFFEDKQYVYEQSRQNDLFGSAFVATGLRDRVTLEHLHNNIDLSYTNALLGDFSVSVFNKNYNYGYDKIVILNEERIINRIKGDIYGAGGTYHKYYKGFNLKGEAGINVSGDFEGNFIKGEASIQLNKNAFVKATLNHNSSAPNFNTLLYQSDYRNFNWQNRFNNIETQQLGFQIRYKKLINLNADYTLLSDYVYFGSVENEEVPQPESVENEETPQPESVENEVVPQQIQAFQNDATINYFRVKLENEITVGKFSLNNTVLYQDVEDENNVLNVPEITTRNTFYYSTHLFKKAMYMQTGVTLNYFTKFYLNAYNPVIAEFYVQNEREFGNFPRLDFFINAKIRQTRIFLKAEHFNSSFTGFDFYSAPNVPYRDFTIRFGLVWNFFL